MAVVVAEWLRRWTRNPLGSPRAGSNPADNELIFSLFCHLITWVTYCDWFLSLVVGRLLRDNVPLNSTVTLFSG